MTETDKTLATLIAALPSLSMEDLGALSAAIEKTRQDMATAGRSALLEEFRTKAGRLGVSLEELIGRGAPAKGKATRGDAGKKVAAKFRGPNGEEWTGRGRKPNWLTMLEAHGRSADEFLI
ncbi:MAG: uncharacterized protein JWR10_3077 [Rubritepida sp.]|nr:uncharacterized protein [Rubritepida sp.]